MPPATNILGRAITRVWHDEWSRVHENRREPDPGDDHDGRAGVGSRLVDGPERIAQRAGWCYSSEPLARRGVVRGGAGTPAPLLPLVLPSPLKIAAIALRRV